MNIWYSPDTPEPDSSWVWVKTPQGVRNWLAAGATRLALPKDAQDLAEEAKAARVKITLQD